MNPDVSPQSSPDDGCLCGESDLAAVIRSLVEEVVQLRKAVTMLMDEFADLTLDGAYSEPREPHPRSVLYSMPLDPTAKDWQLNRVHPSELPQPPSPWPRRQQQLFG